MQVRRLAVAGTTLLITDAENAERIYGLANSLHTEVVDSLVEGGGLPKGWQMPNGSTIDFTLQRTPRIKHKLSLGVQVDATQVATHNPLFDGNPKPQPNEYNIAMTGDEVPDMSNFKNIRLPSLQFYLRRQESEIELSIFGAADKQEPDKLPINLELEAMTGINYIISVLGQFVTGTTEYGPAELIRRLSLTNTASLPGPTQLTR